MVRSLSVSARILPVRVYVSSLYFRYKICAIEITPSVHVLIFKKQSSSALTDDTSKPRPRPPIFRIGPCGNGSKVQVRIFKLLFAVGVTNVALKKPLPAPVQKRSFCDPFFK